MTIPPHRHVIRLRLFHADVFAAYGLPENSQISLRVPYDIKDQHVRYETLDGQPFIPPYGDIHHRTETLYGVSDGELLWWKQPRFLTGASGAMLLGAGITLPWGKTVPDPVELGLEGKKHEHLQFGSGTVDPRLTASASQHAGSVIFGEALDVRFGIYQGRNGFRSPLTVQWNAGPGFPIGRAQVAVEFSGQYQSQARWHGKVDEGTGLTAGGLLARASLPLSTTSSISAGIYRELFAHGSDGQTFHQGTTYSLSISRLFP